MSEKEMQDLLDLVEKTLGQQWLDIADWLREQNSLDELEERIRRGDRAGAVKGIEEAALKWAAETQSGYVTAGQAAANWLDNQQALSDSLVRFDLDNPNVLRRAQQNQLEYVNGFRDEQNKIAQQVTHQALVEGTRLAENPRVIAKRFRDSIGLAPQHQQWLDSYRASLENGDYANALSRELSNGHSDRTIQAAMDGGRALTQDQMDAAIERYRQNLLTYRAETIARTETLRNVHDGVHDGFTQAIQRGDLEVDELEKEWIHAGGGPHSRPDHVAMDEKTVAFRDTFNFPDGVSMKYPGDDAGGAAHNSNCRCTFATTIRAA